MSRLTRTTPLKRMSEKKQQSLQGKPASSFTAPRTGIKKKARTPSEFARIYGSRERVSFVKRLPCVYCVALSPVLVFAYDGEPRCDNAHTENEGKGRKGHHTTIVPLCRSHHRLFDEYDGPFADATVRDGVKAMAPKIEGLWQRQCLRASARAGGG